ncbi:MAG: SRPBCC family protein [Anaerolineae bacterium]
MPRSSVSIEMDAPCETVFAIIHDYDCRLEWDTMLREARLLGGATSAGLGVRSLCTGTWRSAFLALEAEYIHFEPGRVAAVKLTNRPLFFEHFAATLRHDPLNAGRLFGNFV